MSTENQSRITLTLRAAEGQTLEQIMPYIQSGAHVSIGRGLAVIDQVEPSSLGGEPELVAYHCVDEYGQKKVLLPGAEGIRRHIRRGSVLKQLTYMDSACRLQAEVERLTDSLANHDTAAKCMTAWVAEKGQMPWATAIKMLAVLTKMPDAERDQLLGMDDGSTERGALIAERDKAQARTAELEGLLRETRTVLRNIVKDKKGGAHYAAALNAAHQISAALALAEGAKS